MKLSQLRSIVKEALVLEAQGEEEDVGTEEPSDAPKGFYDYDYDIGTDQWIAGPNAPEQWYRAPGAQMGSMGDPFRPEDPLAYLGFTAPPDDSAASPPSAGGEEGIESRGEEANVEDAEELH